METLGWTQLRALGRTDNARRWYPRPEFAVYFADIRAPSRAWPSSYARAAMTKKFARWLAQHHPDAARAVGLVCSSAPASAPAPAP